VCNWSGQLCYRWLTLELIIVFVCLYYYQHYELYPQTTKFHFFDFAHFDKTSEFLL
jgi:hypothetical protein